MHDFLEGIGTFCVGLFIILILLLLMSFLAMSIINIVFAPSFLLTVFGAEHISYWHTFGLMLLIMFLRTPTIEMKKE